MNYNKKTFHPLILGLIGSIALLILQLVWISFIYVREYQQLTNELHEAFAVAYQKEQTYRAPVADIVRLGEISMQSCGREEILIIRKCDEADTIVYNNSSGYSAEKFIYKALGNLREQLVPMNLYCLSDLFAGILHDKDIPLSFVVERYNTQTGNTLETSLFTDSLQSTKPGYNVVASIEISDTESVRALCKISISTVFRNMTVFFIAIFILTIIIFSSIVLLCRYIRMDKEPKQSNKPIGADTSGIYNLGQYTFNPQRNELMGFGETIQLNKKENSILNTLCMQQGDIVEREFLLNDNWGDSGVIYSRSLDTYLAGLRKHLKKDPLVQIITVKGVGYKLVCGEN